VAVEQKLSEEEHTEKEPSYWTMSQSLQSLIPRAKSGIGHSEMKTTDITKLKADPHSLLDKFGEKMTQKHLNRLISAQLVHRVKTYQEYDSERGLVEKEEKEVFLIYFLSGGRVRWMDLSTFLYYKREEELAYVRFLLHKRAEVTQNYNAFLMHWTDEIDKSLKKLYGMKKEDVPPFKLHYVDPNGTDKEIEYKSLEIQTDEKGSFVFYQAMEGVYDSLSLEYHGNFKYRPDKLRALHYQIITDNNEMIDLKQRVGEILARSEDAILEEFLRDNQQFRKIEAN
jgi:hypothetical protein